MNLIDRDEKNREFFNNHIDDYDDTHATYMDTKKLLTDNLPDNTNKVLDLGAGTGLELIELFKKFPNASVTAIDISEAMLDKLSKRDFAKNVNIICDSFFDVDFGNNFDACVSTSALHHFSVEEKNILYKKIYDSLTSNGLFINCDKISLSKEAEDFMQNEAKYNAENYVHLDTPLFYETEEKILNKVGFKNVDIYPTDKENYRLIIAGK